MSRAVIGGIAASCIALLLLPGAACAQQGLTVTAPPTTPTIATKATLLPGTCRDPEYPLTSIRRKETGRALIRLYVDEQGTVTDTWLIESSGSRLLDQETAYAFRSCRLLPARDVTGKAVKSTYLKGHEWKLEQAPPDPWALLSLRQGEGYAAVADFSAIPFSGASLATPEQRVKMLQATSTEATEKAQCPSIEQATARIVPGGAKDSQHSLELWTLKQCGQDIRYVVAIFAPPDQHATFRMMPLAPSQPSP